VPLLGLKRPATGWLHLNDRTECAGRDTSAEAEANDATQMTLDDRVLR
jgi:hypothetical protein